MRFNKISAVFEYIHWLLKQQQLQSSTIYRIVNIKKLPNEQCKLIIQVIGKSMFLEYTPQKIAADDCMLEGFSKKDIRTITYFACEQIKKPKYKIIMQNFCDKLNRIVFKLQKRDGADEIITKTANQIFLDKNLINSLDHDDMHSIGYTAGYEHFQMKEKKYE